MLATKFCQGISDISDSYSAFIIDQWGVLHNGEAIYDGVAECLRELKARKKVIILLSNSGKREEENRQRLRKLGLDDDLYDFLITSGELTWQGIKDQSEGFFKGLGTKCYLISRGGDQSVIRGTPVEAVNDPEDAEFLLISGVDSPEKTIADYEPALKVAARKRLKAICCNPDTKAIVGDGVAMGPGMVALRYQDFGGVVHFVGKPHKPVFQHCAKLLQKRDIYPGETVVIGDSMEQDIAGGFVSEMDTALVRTGMHAGHFRSLSSLADLEKALSNLVTNFNNIRPRYLLNRLSWGKALPDRKHKKRKLA